MSAEPEPIPYEPPVIEDRTAIGDSLIGVASSDTIK